MPAVSPEAIAKKRANEKAYRAANKEKIADANKIYRLKGAENKKTYCKDWRKQNADHANNYAKTKIESLENAYLALKLGLPLATVPPELLEMKKEQLLLLRASKQLTETLKEMK
jgi:hypothetical protein